MYRLLLGKISDLSAHHLPPEIIQSAPEGVRRLRWLAGRVLLSRIFPKLPEISYGQYGKPAFSDGTPLWFNLSHSGDYIALFISDEGEVGCDIEVIRPRKNWRAIAEVVFSASEQNEIYIHPSDNQLIAFWRLWTRKEAIIKQCGASAWQIGQIDSMSLSPGRYVSHCQLENLSIAVCTATQYMISSEKIVSWNNIKIDTLLLSTFCTERSVKV